MLKLFTRSFLLEWYHGTISESLHLVIALGRMRIGIIAFLKGPQKGVVCSCSMTEIGGKTNYEVFFDVGFCGRGVVSVCLAWRKWSLAGLLKDTSTDY